MMIHSTMTHFSIVGILAVVALTAWPTTELRAQSLYDYIRRYEISLGGIYSQSDIYDTYDGERVPTQRLHTTVAGGSLGAGLHVPIVELSDALAIGVNADLLLHMGSAPYDPAFPGTIEHLDQSSGWLRLAIPLFATLKYGTDATMRPETEMGVGIGIGYRPIVNFGADYSSGSVVAMGEFSFLIADVLVKLRGTAPLTAEHPAEGVDIRTYDFSILFLPGE